MNIAFILSGIAMLAVVGVMVAGMVCMARGDSMENKKLQNKLMTARIWLQAAAIGLLLLAFATSKN